MHVFAGGQMLLIGTGATEVFRLPPQGGPVATWSGTIPDDVALLGLTAHTQALLYGGVAPFALSNARDLLIGY